jgi:hypothetical protein
MITIEIKGESIEEVAKKMIEILSNFKIVHFTGKEDADGDAHPGDPA